MGVSNSTSTISVIICTRNRADSIANAVGSVLRGRDAALELIVVDQSDSSATAEALESLRLDPRLRYFHSTRVGLSAAYNAGIRESRGDILAFTDDDCVVPPDWLTNVRAEFETHADTELVYGQVCAPGTSLAPGDVIPEFVVERRRRLAIGESFEVAGMGANFAARRSTLRRIGGFDEALGGGGPLRSSQDFDLMFRLFRAAGVTVLSPTIWVEHHGRRTAATWPQTMVAYGTGDGAFYMKHIRCGDTLAARLLLGRLSQELGKALLKPVVKHHRHPTAYLVGLLKGSYASFHFKVDHRLRLYVGQ